MSATPNPYAPCPCGSGKKFKFCCQGKPAVPTPATGVQQALQGAGELVRRGQLAQAEAVCRQILAAQPDQPEASHLLGLIAGRTGRYEEAEERIGRAIRAKPGAAIFHLNLGNVYQAQGKLDAAIGAFQESLRLKPDFAEAFLNLGNALRLQDRLAEAVEAYQRVLALQPEHPDTLMNLGNVYREQGDIDAAVAAYQRALARRPDFAEAYLNLGQALRQQDKMTEAVEAYQRVLALQSDHHEALLGLGNAYREQGEFDMALATYQRALALRPDSPEGYFDLGQVFHAISNYRGAITSFRQAILLKPVFPLAHQLLGVSLSMDGQCKAAEACFEQALIQKPDAADAAMHLGSTFMAQGCLEEAVAQFGRALEIAPEHAVARSNLLLALQYASHVGLEEIFRQHRLFGAQFDGLTASATAHGNLRDPGKRIRIGYVSPDFRGHSVAYFAETVMSRHDHAHFEVYGYYNNVNSKQDALTVKFKSYCDHWRNIEKLDDDRAADLIRQDGIDILVDLAGHTGGNRLPLLARKPAPVQVTWLGHPNTTGMKAMDYRITDRYAEPPGMTENLNTETLWRLPDIFCCYTPCAANPGRVASPELAPRPAPALDQGYVTFGSFNNIAKLSPPTIALWARLLHAVPGSRLMLEGWWLDGEEMRDLVCARFAAHGIGPERLILLGRKPEQQYVLYHEIDIALDPFPCVGGTTSFDTLWMGVPLVTLAGKSFVSRMGVSLLSNLGLEELIADDEDAYVEIARALAQDLERLNRLRLELRPRMENSPLLDAGRFVKHMEDAYRGMWRAWCEREERAVKESLGRA